jgi:FAD synthase
VIQAFDEALRRTPYDVFVEQIRERAALSGFLMTPDAAFGFERAGTPETLAALGRRDGFDVVVVPPFDLAGRPVRSSEIRSAIAEGRLDDARTLLGRPLRYVARVAGHGVGEGASVLAFPLPVALPPAGDYPVTAEIAHGLQIPTRLVVSDDGQATLAMAAPEGATVAITLPSASPAT